MDVAKLVCVDSRLVQKEKEDYERAEQHLAIPTIKREPGLPLKKEEDV